MKNILKSALHLIVTSLILTPAFAKTTGLKADISGLATITQETEEGVEDIFFNIEEQVRYTHLNSSGLHPDSLEAEDEEAVLDVQFSPAEVEYYQKQIFENHLQQLIPVQQETEEGVHDVIFTASERKTFGS